MENFTEVIDDGATLRLKVDGVYKSVYKVGAEVKAQDIYVFISDNIGKSYSNTYASAALADAARVTIEAMLDIPAGGASATEATALVIKNAVQSIDTKTPSGAQVLTSSVVTDDATISAGASSIGFYTSVDFIGTINGVARSASTFYGFEAAPGKTLPAIAYVTTVGSLTIDKLV